MQAIPQRHGKTFRPGYLQNYFTILGRNPNEDAKSLLLRKTVGRKPAKTIFHQVKTSVEMQFAFSVQFIHKRNQEAYISTCVINVANTIF